MLTRDFGEDTDDLSRMLDEVRAELQKVYCAENDGDGRPTSPPVPPRPSRRNQQNDPVEQVL